MRRSSSAATSRKWPWNSGSSRALGQQLEERLHRHQRVSDLVDDLGDQLAERGEPVEPAHLGVEAREPVEGRGGGEGRGQARGRGGEGGERLRPHCTGRVRGAAEQQ